jgi:SprT-like family
MIFEKSEVVMNLKISLAVLFSWLFFVTSLAHTQQTQKETRVHSDQSLQEYYTAANDAYFNNRLPQVTLHWTDIPRNEKGEFVLGQTLSYVGHDNFGIEIDTKTNVAGITAELSLLHEMCHVDNMIHNGGVPLEDQHGKEFQTCMKTLALEGAFQKLW